MRFATIFAAAAVLSLSAGAAFADSLNDFSAPLTLSATPGPGVWSVDRFPPATFQSQVAYGGHANTLEIGTVAADYHGGTFTDTQGRATKLESGTTFVSAQIYIDPGYLDTRSDARLAELWGVGTDGLDITAYPLLGVARVSDHLEYKAWNTLGGFFSLGTIAASDIGTWQTISYKLDGANILYGAGSFTGMTGALGTTSFDSAIVQAINTGGNRTHHFDNLFTSTGAVPEPATWAMMILGFGGVGLTVRRRRGVMAVA
ncbi:MAG: hypothetical protein AB203_00620 [Parcubacteria bacterium C7867-008]|nr:MAG: hypothetical protein AB203_00620 [Parcubacteria bacterium C7867-008]